MLNSFRSDPASRRRTNATFIAGSCLKACETKCIRCRIPPPDGLKESRWLVKIGSSPGFPKYFSQSETVFQFPQKS